MIWLAGIVCCLTLIVTSQNRPSIRFSSAKSNMVLVAGVLRNVISSVAKQICWQMTLFLQTVIEYKKKVSEIRNPSVEKP